MHVIVQLLWSLTTRRSFVGYLTDQLSAVLAFICFSAKLRVSPMAIAADIVINDGQATPVAHTFVPLGFDQNQVFWFEEQGAQVPLLRRKISLQLVRNDKSTGAAPNAGQLTTRVKVQVHLPTGETIGTADNGIEPPPTLAYVLRSMNEFVESGRSTDAERDDLHAFAANLLANAQVKAMITDWISVR